MAIFMFVECFFAVHVVSILTFCTNLTLWRRPNVHVVTSKTVNSRRSAILHWFLRDVFHFVS